MLKKLILFVCIIAPMTIFAQDKIAYLNSQEIVYNMPEIKGIESQLASKQEILKKNLDAVQNEYQTKLEEYGQKLEKFQKGDKTIAESEILDAQSNLSQLQQRYETLAQTSQTEYEKLQQDLLNPIHQKVGKAIKDVGEEQKFTYIIEASSLLYVSTSAIDASKFVKAKLGITN